MCNKEVFWGVLAHKVGKGEWADDPEFNTAKARLRNRHRVTEMLDAVLMEKTTSEMARNLCGEVPAAPVNDVKSALDSPFVREEGRIRDYAPQWRHDPDAGEPLYLPGRRDAGPMAPPPLGTHTDDLLGELGYDKSRIRSSAPDRRHLDLERDLGTTPTKACDQMVSTNAASISAP